MDVVFINELSPMSIMKRKKTRRGKKKNAMFRNRSKPTTATCDRVHNELETENTCVMCSEMFTECENLNNNLTFKTKNKRKRRGLLRPRYSPKAPKNYTSYIMDDHIENRDGYLSYTYESPDSVFGRNELLVCSYSPGFIDQLSLDNCANSLIKYDSEKDVKNKDLDFIKNDFECMYNTTRAEELAKQTKCELIESVCKMEEKADHLLRSLDKVNSQTTNSDESLKHNIKKIQLENKRLKAENEILMSILQKQTI